MARSLPLPQGPARTAAMAGLAALGMLGLGFASVPLYRAFCQATGFGGTTQRATEAQLASIATADQGPGRGADRELYVRFDSNVAPGMPWQFYPEHARDRIKIGAKTLAIFVARNLSDKPVTGRATFNVTPDAAGAYFTKIQCFCFTEQTLQPGQEVRMPVLYYVDPKFLDDQDDRDVQEITLSYTFYPIKTGEKRS